MHWANRVAEKIIERFPNKRKYVCASGITPSGTVHIGNLRDVITSEFVVRALQDKGKKAELIWSWDDYDRFRKIPQNVPAKFIKYLGLPLSKVPDPFSCHGSYALHFESELEESLPQLGIKTRFIRQSEMYEKNTYWRSIKKALQERQKIARILFTIKAQKKNEEDVENYYPLNVYCQKCERDSTRITDYDGENLVSYECKCGFKETADISKKNIGKLAWRVDWPMRWAFEDVSFEPAGRDHYSAGGSFDVCPKIEKEVFGAKPLYFIGYEWLGITGQTHKMSGSTGVAFTSKMLLEIYEPEIIRWFFARVEPMTKFDFDLGDQILRNYSEWDALLQRDKEGQTTPQEKEILRFSSASKTQKNQPGSISFRQLAGLSQISRANAEATAKIVTSEGGKISSYDLKERLPRAFAWTQKYAPEEYRVQILEKPNQAYWHRLSQRDKDNLKKLLSELEGNWSKDKLTALLYSIPKAGLNPGEDPKAAQREFFQIIYQLLLGAKRGPRLPTFMLALGKKEVFRLLTFHL